MEQGKTAPLPSNSSPLHAGPDHKLTSLTSMCHSLEKGAGKAQTPSWRKGPSCPQAKKKAKKETPFYKHQVQAVCQRNQSHPLIMSPLSSQTLGCSPSLTQSLNSSDQHSKPSPLGLYQLFQLPLPQHLAQRSSPPLPTTPCPFLLPALLSLLPLPSHLQLTDSYKAFGA